MWSWKRAFTLSALLAILAGSPASAQDGLIVTAQTDVVCDSAEFSIEVANGVAPYDLSIHFGDGETGLETNDGVSPTVVDHTYPASGEYSWSVEALDVSDPALQGSASGSLLIGPRVSLTTDLSPPIYLLQDGEVTVNYSATVIGGEAPFAFAWEFDGVASPESGETASHVYTAGGKYQAAVTVTDGCGLSHMDTLSIVVVDSEDICHPMAQRIADGVSSLFPDQAEQLYICEEIFGFFQGDLTGSQLGFGRMWHAYNLALQIEELTWEEILDWHLEGSGWGLLLQLDKFAEAVDDVGIADLVTMVMSGETTVQDVRSAVRAVTRYDADFEDALQRVDDGASPGQLGQFYRAAQDLDMDPEILDGYLDMGLKLQDLQHANRIAEGEEADWTEVIEARAEGHSWGEIKQAYRLQDEAASANEILEAGVNEFRRQEREQNREEQQTERESEQDARTAAKIAQQFGVSEAEVTAVYEGSCAGDWSCVRRHFRNQTQSEHGGGPPEGRGNNK